ncbi:MAG: M20/M25/M40 family metallo-hydrolase [Proteobacteria bacterium]|nr:M20/M25/M40 family metallo-hydrolase [Pseudomonadota bacterium]
MLDPQYGEDAVTLLRQFIRNACVNTGDPSSGNEIISVRTVQEYLGDEGTVIEPLPGRASVIYRIPGSDPAAPRLLMIPHLDVVPANPEGWTHDPFTADIADGFVWGRGTVDMLNVTAAMVSVFKAFQTGDLPAPTGDLVLACVADEEAGSVYGANHLVEEHWDLIACDAVLTEVAGPMLQGAHGRAIPVTVAEKGPGWRRVKAHGIAGHGSQPYGRSNAVIDLASAFARIGTAPQPTLITEEWTRFVPHLPVSEVIRAMLTDVQHIDAAIDLIAEDDQTLARWIHACTHLTFSPNTISGGTKANVIPAESAGNIDVRMLPGQDANDISDHLRKVLGPDDYAALDFQPVLEMQANGTLPEGPLWEAMADAAEIHTGSRLLAPTLTPVTTDARFFRARGIPAYGVGLFDESVTFPEMLAMFHGMNERVSVESVKQTTAYLASVVESFSQRVSV